MPPDGHLMATRWPPDGHLLAALRAQEEVCVPYQHCANPSLPNCSKGHAHVDDFSLSPPPPPEEEDDDNDDDDHHHHHHHDDDGWPSSSSPPPSPSTSPPPRPPRSPPPPAPPPPGVSAGPECSTCSTGAPSMLYRAASAYASLISPARS